MEELCRICLQQVPQAYRVPLSYTVRANKTACELIKECAPIQICEQDILPQHLCSKCYQQLLMVCDFRELIIYSDHRLKERALESVKNPPAREYVFVETKECPSKPANRSFGQSQSTSELQLIRTGGKAGRKPSKVAKITRKVHDFQCEICKKVLIGRSNRLQQHIIMAHSDIKNYPCEMCQKKFKSRQQLVNHSRIHTGEKPYECNLCKATFRSTQSLFNHKKKHTGKHKSYKCAMCEKGYATPGELETHRRIVHTGEKPFLCEICSRVYSSLRNLGLHKRSVHEKTEKCPKCSLMLSTKRIKQHLQKHRDQEEGIRRYTCDQCGKGFFTPHVLKRHQTLHLGHKPYSCEVCHKAFSQKCAVDTHMRAHSDVRGYSCSFCEKTFKYKQHLQQHLGKKHQHGRSALRSPI